jgi:hypothetical protein
MNPENINKVWKFMSDNGEDVGTLDEFTTAIQDSNNLEKVYSYMKNNDKDVGDFKTFKSFTVGDDRKPLDGTSLADRDFGQELAEKQAETDRKFRDGESSWFGRRGTQLRKTWVKLKEDAVSLAEIVATKMGADELAGDLELRRREIAKDKDRLSASIPTPLKKSFAAKVVGDSFNGNDIEITVNSDGSFREARDLDGFATQVSQEFVDNFNESGRGRSGSRQYHVGSFLTTAEETLLDVGVMIAGTKGVGLATRAGIRGAGRAGLREGIGRASVGSIAGFQSIGDNFAENLREFDGDVDKASNVSLIQSGITGMVTMMFPAIESGGALGTLKFKNAIKAATLEGGEKTLPQRAMSVGRAMLGEAAEENIDNWASTYVGILNGAEGEVFDWEEFIATTAISALVAGPIAVFNSGNSVSDQNVFIQGLYEASKSPDGRTKFEKELDNSDLSDEEKTAKRDLVGQIGSNIEVANLSEEDGVKLTALIVNKNKLKEKLNDDLEPVMRDDINEKISEIDHKIDKLKNPDKFAEEDKVGEEATDESDEEVESKEPKSNIISDNLLDDDVLPNTNVTLEFNGDQTVKLKAPEAQKMIKEQNDKLGKLKNCLKL